MANNEWMQKVSQVREKLATRFNNHPGVSLIDIGFDPESDEEPRPVVVRVHVSRSEVVKTLDLSEEMDGVPVRIMVGDYRLE